MRENQRYRRILEDRFARLVYKGEKMTVKKPRQKDETDQMFRSLQKISSRDDLAQLTKTKVLQIPEFRRFYDRHFIATKYSFQV